MYPIVCLIDSDWLTMSKPATWPEPADGVMMPQSIRMVVDFPAPLGPRNPKISPRPNGEADAIDGHKIAEPFLQVLHRDDRRSGFLCGVLRPAADSAYSWIPVARR